MSVTVTSIVLGLCVVVLATCVILSRRPYAPGQFNYIPVMIVLMVVGMALARHLLGLVAGI